MKMTHKSTGFYMIMLGALIAIYTFIHESNITTAVDFMHIESDSNDHEYKLMNMSYSVPALWILGPAKTSTSSLLTGMIHSFSHWSTPFQTNIINTTYYSFTGRHEMWWIWASDFGRKCYEINIEAFYRLMIENISIIISNQNITTLNDYPFDKILLSLDNIQPLEPMVRNNIIKVQNHEFRYGINMSMYDKSFISIQKSPMLIYVPLTSIIFANWISPTDTANNLYGTKLLIMVRNPIKRVLSWYSMFFIKRFMNIRKYNNRNDKLDNLIIYQLLKVPMQYEPLNKMRQMIINRTNEFDDILILNEHFAFYYRFQKLFLSCKANQWKGNECKKIDICFYKCYIDRDTIFFHSPIHMLFTGLWYSHLLLNLNLFKQKNLLSSKLRLMSFEYLIHNPQKTMFLLKCWTEGNVICNHQTMMEYQSNHKQLWDKIDLPKMNSKTQNVSVYIKNKLKKYLEPIFPKVNELIHRFNKNDDIFIGDWIQY